MKENDNKSEKSLVAFYISKFNDDAFRELGYGGPVSKAMDDLSVRITGPGVEPNAYLRRRRDEFDVFLIMEELDNITENQQRL